LATFISFNQLAMMNNQYKYHLPNQHVATFNGLLIVRHFKTCFFWLFIDIVHTFMDG